MASEDPTDPPFLTPKELAARWRLSLSAVYWMKDTGHLPYYQLGGSIRFKWDDVLAYEQAGYQPAVIRPKALRWKRRRVQGKHTRARRKVVGGDPG